AKAVAGLHGKRIPQGQHRNQDRPLDPLLACGLRRGMRGQKFKGQIHYVPAHIPVLMSDFCRASHQHLDLKALDERSRHPGNPVE
ncbi:MAG: hypothetical protein ACYC9S_08040, partial [Leptospirales bacterium]